MRILFAGSEQKSRPAGGFSGAGRATDRAFPEPHCHETSRDERAGGGSRTRMNPLTRRVPHCSRHAGKVRQPDGNRTRPSTVTVSRAIHYTTGGIGIEQYPGQDSNLERRVRGAG